MVTTTGTTLAIEVTGLGKAYPSRHGGAAVWVIRDLFFSVATGEFVAIVGPSGAGKTTLLNVLANIDVATCGNVWIASQRVPVTDTTALSPGLGCRIGYVTQDDHLLPWRNVLDNVLLPLRLQKRLTRQAREHVDQLLGASGLRGFERHYPHELSGGLRKRVSLIRTLAYDPDVILMDEPFSSVDAQTRMLLQRDLLRLWNDRRNTIVFVTHDIAEAIALSDRVLVLDAAPARVKSEHVVGIARPRDPEGLMTCPEAGYLYRAIRAEIE